MSDCISRQAVKDILNKNQMSYHVYPYLWDELNKLPPAQLAKVATDINVGDKDIISRKAAIEEIERWLGYIDDDMVRRMQIGMKRLPPAQPDVPDINVGDMISRQQAIEAVMDCYDNDELFEVYEDKLNSLPPAQPEIIRCKDCKHWIPYDWMFSEVWQSKNMADYPEDEIGCNYCDVAMKANDFCSRGERREVTE